MIPFHVLPDLSMEYFSAPLSRIKPIEATTVVIQKMNASIQKYQSLM